MSQRGGEREQINKVGERDKKTGIGRKAETLNDRER